MQVNYQFIDHTSAVFLWITFPYLTFIIF